MIYFTISGVKKMVCFTAQGLCYIEACYIEVPLYKKVGSNKNALKHKCMNVKNSGSPTRTKAKNLILKKRRIGGKIILSNINMH